jgi:hypothetical protein
MIAFIFGSTLVAWVMYYIIMGLKKRKPEIMDNPMARVLAVLFVFAGVIVDVFYNLTVGSIIFFQIPKQLLFTTRLQDNMYTGGWRSKLANTLCSVLDRLDPDHCGRK